MTDERIFMIRVGRLTSEQWTAAATEVSNQGLLLDREPHSTAQAATPWDAAKDALAPILPDINDQ